MKVDLCIIATRRPDLIGQMLTSFERYVFPRIDIGQVIVNVDPMFGDDADQEKTLQIITHRFPRAIVFTPEKGCFAAAVARVWRETRTEYVLHLEDDWLALQDPGDYLAPFARHPNLAQVVFYMSSHQRFTGIRRKVRPRKFLGLPVLFTATPCRYIGTSPGLYSGPFVRKAAELINPNLDPEKQFGDRLNPPLETYAAAFDSYIQTPDGRHVIADLGREWLSRRGIKKQFDGGAVSWLPVTPNTPAAFGGCARKMRALAR